MISEAIDKRTKNKKQRVLDKLVLDHHWMRDDLVAFFELSGVLTSKSLNHTPFLAFVEHPEGKGKIQLEVIKSAPQLLKLPDSTKVLCQWRGKWNSDLFTFTVKDVREHMENSQL
jgi:hypothetical protein